MSDSENETPECVTGPISDLANDPELNSKIQELEDDLRGVGIDSDESDSSSSADESCISQDLEPILRLLREKKLKNIIVCTGAGISTSAGIPDFRTPGTGLYSNLKKYNLPFPEAVFDISYFRNKPEAFYTLATELLPGHYPPTIGHHFIKLLQDEGILLRCYSQNIDGLDRLAGIDEEKLVEAHGSFNSSRCIQCKKEISNSKVIPALRSGTVLKCSREKCKDKKAFIKPDIVFFGEGLPDRFHQLIETDFEKCDLCIVIGTSLAVYPFASLPSMVKRDCPRLLINRELVGDFSAKYSRSHTKDVFFKGDADAGCLKLAEALGKAESVKMNQAKMSEEILEIATNTKNSEKSKK